MSANMSAAISAVRQRYASSPAFSAAGMPFAPLFAGSKPPPAAPLAAALAAELRAPPPSLSSLCCLVLLLDLHSALWLPRAGAVLPALAAAVSRAPLKPAGGAAELRLLLRPVRNAARRAGSEGLPALDAAVARLPESALEAWYDEGAPPAEAKGKRRRAAAAAAAEAEAEEGPLEGGDDDGAELDEATAMGLLEGLLDEAEELGWTRGQAELQRLLQACKKGGSGGGGGGKQKKKRKAEGKKS